MRVSKPVVVENMCSWNIKLSWTSGISDCQQSDDGRHLVMFIFSHFWMNDELKPTEELRLISIINFGHVNLLLGIVSSVITNMPDDVPVKFWATFLEDSVDIADCILRCWDYGKHFCTFIRMINVSFVQKKSKYVTLRMEIWPQPYFCENFHLFPWSFSRRSFFNIRRLVVAALPNFNDSWWADRYSYFRH